MSEALEFYAGRTAAKPDDEFTRPERKKLLKAAREFTEDKRARVDALVSLLNQPPFMARVRRQLTIDRVPFMESEVELLARVRALRNNLVQGHASTADTSEIEPAVAIVCRALMFGAEKVRHHIAGDV